MEELVLEAVEIADDKHWRWQLREPGGAFVADHLVSLDEDELEFEGFVDLQGLLEWRTNRRDRLASEAELVDRVGLWIGDRVLGAVGDALVANSPVVVRVPVPASAEWLAARPMELAVVDGEPLAVQDVSFVYEPEGTRTLRKRPVGDRLRALGLFSMPRGLSALALRRERHALERLIGDVAATYGKAIELRVLQYGVTRDRLQEVLEEAEGWDVLHFSGHGLPRGLVLETESGDEDVVPAEEFVEMLRPVRRQLKLVTLSSCYSAATLVADTLQVLGVAADAVAAGDAADEDADGLRELPALAQDLSAGLDAAVLAMRYPIVDDFAVSLGEELYALLFGKGQPLARSLQLALRRVLPEDPDPGTPPISVATPTLVGAAAGDLVLRPPDGAPLVFDQQRLKLADFPDQPERFVGRSGPMSRASAALATRSGRTGVLFHGMAGAGKTACALELAYTHHDGFAELTWFQAPLEGQSIVTSLADLATHLEFEVEGLSMVGRLDDAAAYARLLEELAEFWRQQRLVLVIDNVESLLTPTGAWRDPRWGQLVEALTSRSGRSRLVMTSRRVPTGLGDSVLVEPIHALSPQEAVLLARQLPNLGALISGTAAGVAIDDGRRLVTRTLSVVQGHPELLRLADGDAEAPDRLRGRLASADPEGERAAAGVLFEADDEDSTSRYLGVLDGWAREAANDLPPAPALLFSVLCSVEPDDRIQSVIEANWADIWVRLEREGDPPDLSAATAELEQRALVAVEASDLDDPSGATYRVHPAVATSGRHQTEEAVRVAVDIEMAAFWNSVHQQAAADRASTLAALSGRRASPYLLRRGEWELAGSLLERALHIDGSPMMVNAVLPALEAIAEATRGTDVEGASEGVLVRALELVSPDVAEERLRRLVERSAERGDLGVARVGSKQLAYQLMARGRLPDALAAVERAIEFGDRTDDIGEWTRVGDEVTRLQVRVLQGEYEQVMEEVGALWERLDDLPEEAGPQETVDPWSVRETLLDTGHTAALRLGQWEQVLQFVDAIASLEAARQAPLLEIARTQFNAFAALNALGRTAEARELLRECQTVFREENDINGQGVVLGAFAQLEAAAGRVADAVDLETRALRYHYASRDTRSVSVGHHQLANYLGQSDAPGTQVIAHRLACALLETVIGSGGVDKTLMSLAIDLAVLGDEAAPSSYPELCRRVEIGEGIDFSEFVARLAAAELDLDAVLADLVERAGQVDVEQLQEEQHRARLMGMWEPVLQAVALAAAGDPEAQEVAEANLEEFDEMEDWSALTAALRRLVAAGDRVDRDELVVGLDEIDVAVLDRALELAAVAAVQASLFETWDPVIEGVVRALAGDEEVAADVHGLLDELAATEDWAALAAAMRRLFSEDGVDDPTTLFDGLDDVDSLIMDRLIDVITAPEPEDEDYLEQWEPLLAALVAAARDPQLLPAFEALLAQPAAISDWVPLTRALARMAHGERDRGSLLDGLDEIDVVIATAALDRLGE